MIRQFEVARCVAIGACIIHIAASALLGESSRGERVSPAGYGVSVIESMADVLQRDRELAALGPVHPKDRNGQQGVWIVPSKRATYFPHSGEHNLVNKWGDTRMGIGFPSVVNVQGAYFAGQAGRGAWTGGIRVIGYRDGVETNSTKWFRSISDKPMWFQMDLKSVDRIVIVSTPVVQGGGWYGMDDLTFTDESAVAVAGEPSPPTVLDFEDVVFGMTLTGSGYDGLVWERGTGEFSLEQPIHHPLAPPRNHPPEPLGPLPGPAQQAGGGGTTPQLVESFEGAHMGQAGSFSFPPDTMGAIGPNHFVVAVNGVFAVYDKSTGNLLMDMRLTSFIPNSSGDPRILFDQQSGRWFLVNSGFSSNARIAIAVSLTDDPTGEWFKTSFLTAEGSDTDKWPDYETFGVDANGIYTATFMVPTRQGQSADMTIFAIDKAPLIAATPSLGTITAFRALPWEGAIQPVHTFGGAPGEYLVSRTNSTLIRLRRIDPPMTSPTLMELGFVSIPEHFFPPDAPVMGSTTPLDTVGHRLMMSIVRDGSIWTAHAVSVSGRSACRWYEIDAASVSLIQSGTVSDASLHYFFPSIMVNGLGHTVMGFSGSNANQFASAYYAGRLRGDPPGEMSSAVLLKAGEGTQNLLDGSGRNRFGDYSYTTLDPVDGRTMWTVQEYTRPDNRWGTWIGALRLFTDCNNNLIPDGCDINCGATGTSCDIPGCGTSDDCNSNSIPDECEAPDCNVNGVLDECEVLVPGSDCNGNGVPDDCDIAGTGSSDCNSNGVPDECDIAALVSTDCNGNNVPDECDIADMTSIDCQPNGLPDECDLASQASVDCNTNSVPDECDLAAGTSQDCQFNGDLDECDVISGASQDCVGPPTTCFSQHSAPGCNSPLLEACVCGGDSFCCTATWDNNCVVAAVACSQCPPGQAGNLVPDECEMPCSNPSDCDDSDPCTANTCNANGFCRFPPAFDPATTCCHRVSGAQFPIDDGSPCTVGSCDTITGGIIQTPVPDGPIAGCGANDPCSDDTCVSGVCVRAPVIYGDVTRDGAIDTFDLFCVLDGFSGDFSRCTFGNMDLAPCVGNGTLNVFDLFAVLDAFAGTDVCCATGP